MTAKIFKEVKIEDGVYDMIKRIKLDKKMSMSDIVKEAVKTMEDRKP